MVDRDDALALAMAALGGWALYRGRIRPRMYAWGATDDELRAELPGDELVVAAMPRTTRAVTIGVPPDRVWPWLVQIGEDRAGFYSYSLLERAAGAKIHNANAVHPEWQDVRVGDTVWLARRYGDAGRQVVAAVEPESHLVLMSPQDFTRVQRGERALGAWRFALQSNDGRTRLLARGSGAPVGQAMFDLIHFVMERKMLIGIRHRAERGGTCLGSPITGECATPAAIASRGLSRRSAGQVYGVLNDRGGNHGFRHASEGSLDPCQ